MTRQELDDRLVDYLYDELDASEREAFEEAVVAYPDLQAEVAAHQRTRGHFADLEPEPMPVGLLDGVMREARLAVAEAAVEKPSLFEQLFSLFLQPAFATALVAVLAVGTTWVVLQPGAKEDGAPAPALTRPAAEADQPRMAAAERVPERARAAATAAAEEKQVAAADAPAANPTPAPVAGEPIDVAAVDLDDAAAGAETGEGLKPVGDGTVAQLVEVGTRAKAKAGKKAKGKAKKARPKQPVQLAGGDRDLAQMPLPGGAASAYNGSYGSGAGGAAGRESEAANVVPSKSQAPAEAKPAAAAPPPPPVAKPIKKDAWSRTVEEAAGAKSPKDRAKAWIKAYERYAAQGNDAMAAKALDQLERVPGYGKQAGKYRKKLASQRKSKADTQKGGGKSKALAAPRKKAAAPAPTPSKKATSTKSAMPTEAADEPPDAFPAQKAKSF